MPPLYALSCILLSVAALQFHKVPAHVMPPWVNLLGGATSLANAGMLIAGFFIASWWAPFVLFVLGSLAFSLIPVSVRRDRWSLVLFGGSFGGLGAALAVFA
jgi:hypothetical protein